MDRIPRCALVTNIRCTTCSLSPLSFTLLATEVEGVFRIAGSQKRMRELQEVFDTPPKYGKQLEWERYSVHDAASVLRRYLNQMPVRMLED